MLNTYDDFVKQLKKVGVMSLSKGFPEGILSLERETRAEQWHTDDAKTDPWEWKNRIATDRIAAFGCILGGKKGFITKEIYPLFYRAYRPEECMEEAYYNGTVSHMTYQLYKLFEKYGSLNTAQIRKVLGVTKKDGGSQVDRAIIELQKSFYITVSAAERKRNKDGEEYGWPANRYTLVDQWAGAGWIDGAEDWSRADAADEIIIICTKNNLEADINALRKVLFKGIIF